MTRIFDALEKPQNHQDRADADVRRKSGPSPLIKQRPPDSKACIRMTDEYNRLRQRIVAALPGLKTRALLFASSTDGEEAATVLAAFGRMLERSGERVLLVDADLRSPMLHGLFGVCEGPCLSQLLSGKGDLTTAINRTEAEGLFMVAEGQPAADPCCLLESAGIGALIKQMRQEADWVLLTAPPVNAYNDAVALARKVDGVVLVAEAERTRWEVAQSAKQRLEDAGANILGVVLNNRKLHIPGWIYRRL